LVPEVFSVNKCVTLDNQQAILAAKLVEFNILPDIDAWIKHVLLYSSFDIEQKEGMLH
jgi:hypothetical protein